MKYIFAPHHSSSVIINRIQVPMLLLSAPSRATVAVLIMDLYLCRAASSAGFPPTEKYNNVINIKNGRESAFQVGHFALCFDWPFSFYLKCEVHL